MWLYWTEKWNLSTGEVCTKVGVVIGLGEVREFGPGSESSVWSWSDAVNAFPTELKLPWTFGCLAEPRRAQLVDKLKKCKSGSSRSVAMETGGLCCHGDGGLRCRERRWRINTGESVEEECFLLLPDRWRRSRGCTWRSHSSYGLSLGMTSSRGLAPPKIAELGFATWFRGPATVLGFSCSRGRCARSSAAGAKEEG